jgi:hypothetical protein
MSVLKNGFFMNWYKNVKLADAKADFFRWVHHFPPNFWKKFDVGDKLPPGFRYSENPPGRWSILGPGNWLISWDEPNRLSAKKVSLVRLVFWSKEFSAKA